MALFFLSLSLIFTFDISLSLTLPPCDFFFCLITIANINIDILKYRRKEKNIALPGNCAEAEESDGGAEESDGRHELPHGDDRRRLTRHQRISVMTREDVHSGIGQVRQGDV